MTTEDGSRFEDGGLPDAARTAFETEGTFARVDEADGIEGPAYAVESTSFPAFVTARESENGGARYRVAVRVPSLDAATVDRVGPSVRSGWFETMERRLANAPKSTRASVDLAAFSLADADEAGDELRVTYVFEAADADRAARVAKSFVEYVEGTYVETAIPGYEYEGVVGDLLATATSRGGAGGEPGTGGSTPL